MSRSRPLSCPQFLACGWFRRGPEPDRIGSGAASWGELLGEPGPRAEKVSGPWAHALLEREARPDGPCARFAIEAPTPRVRELLPPSGYEPGLF